MLYTLGLGDTAIIYQALFLKSSGNMGPREADELELWEVAVLLKAAYPKDTEESSPTKLEGSDERYRLIRQRIAAAKGEGPPPEVRPVNPNELDQLKL